MYLVTGEGGSVYVVDLEAFGFRGQCDCPHFRCRLQPAIRETRRHMECKHIPVALAQYARENLQQVKEEAVRIYKTASRDVGPT